MLKLVTDKRRWLQCHLLVFDEKGRDAIPSSIKLVAGRTGREYNLRKKRKGAFLGGSVPCNGYRIRRTSIQIKWITYRELNMVRNGVVSHPSEWSFCGYNEIQNPRKKNVLIAYQKIAELTGVESYTAFQETHRELVNESLTTDKNINIRQNQWTESIAIGSKSFIETIKDKLGIIAKGRKIR